MPKIADIFGDEGGQLQVHRIGTFGFSATRLEDLGAAEYTLVTIVADRSGSTQGFQKDMENALKEIVKSCQHSDRSDNLLIRLVAFDDTHEEIHGFKQLPGDQAGLDTWLKCYDGVLKPRGSTALYDASFDAIEAENNYGQQLVEEEFSVNGIVVVITDGQDNRSNYAPNEVGKELARAIKGECLESMVSILVAVNNQQGAQYVIIPQETDRHSLTDFRGTAMDGKVYGDYEKAAAEAKNQSGGRVVPIYNDSDQLSQFDRQAKFSHYVPLDNANKSTIARLAQFVSQSISSQSQALGTGGPSQSIAF